MSPTKQAKHDSVKEPKLYQVTEMGILDCIHLRDWNFISTLD